jgi:nitroreductase
MTTLELTPDELLMTTRAVRKRLDLERPVPMEILKDCLEVAIQAPSGSNIQNWQFIFVTDADKRAQLADLYRQGWEVYKQMPGSAYHINRETPEASATQDKVVSSAEHLVEHLHEVPVFMIPCVIGRPESIGERSTMVDSAIYGSICPAVWSFMLAARARGIGSSWTSVHLMFEEQAAQILGIPYEMVMQVALIPLAYYTGETFKPAPRKPIDQIMHIDGWQG